MLSKRFILLVHTHRVDVCAFLDLHSLHAYLNMHTCCGLTLFLLQILFPLFQTHYHQITITKTKEIKFEPRIKLNHNIHTEIQHTTCANSHVPICYNYVVMENMTLSLFPYHSMSRRFHTEQKNSNECKDQHQWTIQLANNSL